jgi:polyisoprenoid-binding protein YceI
MMSRPALVAFAFMALFSLSSAMLGDGRPDSASSEAVGPLALDPSHSSVIFKITHFEVSHFYGRFNKVSGEITLDERDPKGGTVAIEVDAASVDTHEEARDKHLRSEAFFNARQFPKITFKSRKIVKKGANLEVEGDLSLHGVDRPLTMTLRSTGARAVPRFGLRAGYETEFTFERSAHGITYGLDNKSWGDQVQIILSIEAAPRK